MDPYRLIDGDSRVGNPIHWAEDKFHNALRSGREEEGREGGKGRGEAREAREGDSEGGGARSTAVTSGNYGIGGFVYARICAAAPCLPFHRRLEPCTLG